MNKQVTTKAEELVKELCAEKLSKPSSGNQIKVKKIANDDRFREQFDYEKDVVRTRYVGRILSEATWAEEWSQRYYTIDMEALP